MDEKTLVDVFLTATEKFKDKVALQIASTDKKEAIFYFQVRENVERILWAMNSWEIKKGELIAILSENRPEWIYAYFAILGRGGVVVGIDINLKPPEILFILNHAEIKTIFVSGGALPGLLEIKNQSSLRRIICFDILEGEGVSFLPHILSKEYFPFSYPQISPQDLAMLVYTSGTTGNPKAVMLTHKNISSNIQMIHQIFNWDHRDNFLSLLPLSHMFELTCGLLAPFSSGAKVTYIHSLRPEVILETMEKTKVTYVMVVPAILRLLRLEIWRELKELSLKRKFIFYFFFALCAVLRTFNLILGKLFFRRMHRRFGNSLKFFVSGGAPLSPFLIWWFEVLGINILQGYGLTEASPVVSVNTPRENRLGSVGKPLPGVEVKIENN
ncbi:MAG: AMP-binding protein, partial [Candidatus Omnitrophica bacterium]|nr:AMP-binding protein [Candidatus Omnitrophota bacterium]